MLKMIDYYIKNLPFDVRQEIFKAIGDINSIRIRRLLPNDGEYKSYREIGYTDEQMAEILRQTSERFQCVNDIMIKNGRPPLFADSSDTYECAKRYIELLRRYHKVRGERISAFLNYGQESESEEELIKIMGCTWEDYIPEKYPQPKETNSGV